MLFGCYEFTITREVERGISFAVLAITVREFADKMSFVPPLGPGFTEIQANRT